jgi:hypothetical protein
LEEIHIARAWRTFGPQQIVAVHSLHRAFPEFNFYFHIVSTENPSQEEILHFRECLPPDRISFGFYSAEIIDDYALSCGATEEHLKNFKEWRWIYHLLLYHALFYEEKLEYVLSYDDDIFFQGDLKLVKEILSQRISFSVEDMHTDGDKCMFPQLISYFGPNVFEKYYSAPNNHLSSNSGFMGINLKTIFSQFPRGESFREMLDMFQYSKYEHGKTGLHWKEYKILLQEQSFLSILSRALNQMHIVLSQAEDGYSISHIETSPIQHYVAEKKMSSEFESRVKLEYEKILEDVRDTRS